MTSWGEYMAALDQLLAMPIAALCIFDHDLKRLGLESPERHEALKRIFLQGKNTHVKIAVRDPQHVLGHSPRLMELLRTQSHRLSIQQTPENLGHLRDGMIIADDCHALILFDQDQARSKLILNNIPETQVYLQRFEEIWQSGGQPVSASTIGL